MPPMNYKTFITEQVESIRREVGDKTAINALSGGVDSSVVTVLAHQALGNQLKTIFVDNAIMREGDLPVARDYSDRHRGNGRRH